jgi:micrococcal nuclease
MGRLRNSCTTMLVLLILSGPLACFAWEGRVTEVIRADEIRVIREGTSERIRLYGIDAPVDPQPFGREALLYTTERVRGRTVEIQPLIRDHLDRIIAWVWIDGESLNRELLKKGMVWWYKKYLPFEKELELLEQEAREAKIGLWAKPDPVPPWEFQSLPASEPVGPQIQGLRGRRGIVAEHLREQRGISGRIEVREGQVRRLLQERLEEIRKKYGTRDEAVSPVPELPRDLP